MSGLGRGAALVIAGAGLCAAVGGCGEDVKVVVVAPKEPVPDPTPPPKSKGSFRGRESSISAGKALEKQVNKGQ